MLDSPWLEARASGVKLRRNDMRMKCRTHRAELKARISLKWITFPMLAVF
jgi:hypothetical protein